MNETKRNGPRVWAAAAALLGMAWLATACGSGDETDPVQADIAQAERDAPAGKRAIVDTHIHLWQASRPGGVPWPTAAEGPTIFRDVLPAEYAAVAKANAVVKTIVIEASGIVEDNQWVLDLIRPSQPFYLFVGNLDIGTSNFASNLARFAADQRFVGLRGYLTGPEEGITLSAAQLTNLRDLATRGMTLDIISRGTKNPKAQVQALCTAVPNLRIIIDHLGGAKGPAVDATWAAETRALAKACPNVYMKFSSFYDVYAPGDVLSPSPTDLASYKPNFDVLFDAFGTDRLMFGSNWPVINLHGTFENQVAIAEQYLAPLGESVRDKVMYKNAIAFYRRKP